MKRNAFTLLELLYVIGILSVLSAVLVPVFACDAAKSNQVNAVRKAQNSAVMYTQDYDEAPGEMAGLKQYDNVFAGELPKRKPPKQSYYSEMCYVKNWAMGDYIEPQGPAWGCQTGVSAQPFAQAYCTGAWLQQTAGVWVQYPGNYCVGYSPYYGHPVGYEILSSVPPYNGPALFNVNFNKQNQ